MEGRVQVNGTNLWYRITGSGAPVIQIHGAAAGHFNFDPVSPLIAERNRVIDFDMRGYGASDRPQQHYDMEVWADDVAGLMDALDLPQAHIHGTSMGGMVAQVFAGKYPERTTSVVINCAAAKLGVTGRLIFKNWIDVARLDPLGAGSPIIAEMTAWLGFSRAFMERPEVPGLIVQSRRRRGDVNRLEVYIAACEAMIEMDLSGWLPRITSPTLVITGAEDILTPWDQGPGGVGMEAIFRAIKNAEKYVVQGAGHYTIFERPIEYSRVVTDFFAHNARGS